VKITKHVMMWFIVIQMYMYVCMLFRKGKNNMFKSL